VIARYSRPDKSRNWSEEGKLARWLEVELERPSRELPAERRRLRMDAVRAPDADRVAVLVGATDHDRKRAVDPVAHQRSGIADLQRERGVEHVRGRQSVVDPATLGPELLRYRVDERGEIVVGRLLDLRDALGRRRLRVRANGSDVFAWHGTELSPRVQRRQLHLEPARELALLRPDTGHLRTGVAGDHLDQCRAAVR
jgi:hypothetical protein